MLEVILTELKSERRKVFKQQMGRIAIVNHKEAQILVKNNGRYCACKTQGQKNIDMRANTMNLI